ncbi:unnamed protein product [Cylicocyclus nassatus]|uniref:Uncharacterized protein n=1 Tax=Cylicocyclus nassatus TaxID=53992 RepID=A0AA36DPB2_CYLNA|nr:unnamed protein product [Cylicocyclus nassatus]
MRGFLQRNSQKQSPKGNSKRPVHMLCLPNYVAALQLFADEVASNAIAMGDLQQLRPLAEKMEKATDKIKLWGAIGQVYADYCMLKTMDDEEDSEEM